MKGIINYLRKNNIEITILVFFSVIVMFSQSIPYVNLIVDPVWYGMIFIVLASIILHISAGKIIVFAIIFLAASIPWVMVGSRVAGENFGTYAFICLTIAVIKEVNTLRKR